MEGRPRACSHNLPLIHFFEGGSGHGGSGVSLFLEKVLIISFGVLSTSFGIMYD